MQVSDIQRSGRESLSAMQAVEKSLGQKMVVGVGSLVAVMNEEGSGGKCKMRFNGASPQGN